MENPAIEKLANIVAANNSTTNAFNNLTTSDDVLGDIFCSSEESSLYTSFLICGLLTLIINTFGIVGNLLSLTILSSSFAKVSILLYLIGLSVCDTIMLAADILCFVLPVIFNYFQCFVYYTKIIIPHLAPFGYPLADFGLTGSTYFTIAITIDRYIIICWPLEAKALCTMRRARYSSIIILICSLLFNLPRFFEYATIPKSTPPSSGTVLSLPSSEFQVVVTDYGGHPAYKQWYLLVSWFIFIFIIPLSILLVLNVLICKKVHESNKIRQNLSIIPNAADKNSLSITHMSIVLVIIFMCCHIPFFINRIVQEFLALSPAPTAVYISNILTSINSSVNWIIYCLFGKKFRAEFFKLISCFRCGSQKRRRRSVCQELNIGGNGVGIGRRLFGNTPAAHSPAPPGIMNFAVAAGMNIVTPLVAARN